MLGVGGHLSDLERLGQGVFKIKNAYTIEQLNEDSILSIESAFPNFLNINLSSNETKFFLNSFFSAKFAQNKITQMKKLKRFIRNWDGKKNLVFVTHYVVISESLNYAPSSGEIVVSDKNLKVIDTIEIEY